MVCITACEMMRLCRIQHAGNYHVYSSQVDSVCVWWRSDEVGNSHSSLFFTAHCMFNETGEKEERRGGKGRKEGEEGRGERKERREGSGHAATTKLSLRNEHHG